MEVHGLVKVKVNDEAFGKIKVNVINNDKKGIQLQVSSMWSTMIGFPLIFTTVLLTTIIVDILAIVKFGVLTYKNWVSNFSKTLF